MSSSSAPPQPATGAPPTTILALSDDLLRYVLRRAPRAHAARIAHAAICRRFAEIVRSEETLGVALRCGAHETELFGVGAPALVRGEAVAPLALGVNERSLPRFGDSLGRALDIAHRAHRRSFSAVSVTSLRLQRRNDLAAVLPGILFHIQLSAALGGDRVRGSALTDVALSMCSLPASLGRLVPNVTRLRLYECPVEGGPAAAQKLVAGLAPLPLRTLVWTCSEQSLPASLLTLSPPPEAWHTLSSLVLSFADSDEMGLSEIDVEGGVLGGSALEELRLLLPDPFHTPPEPCIRAVLEGLALNPALRTLYLGANALSALVGSQGARAFFEALPATVTSLGQVECSWMAPSWFFDLLAEHRHEAHGATSQAAAAAGPALASLAELHVFINSPGASTSTDVASALWGDDCALALVSARAADAFPSLERLFVEWYDEDAQAPECVARALAPLRACTRLREVHLLRNNSNCGTLEPGADLDAALPGVRVAVHHEGRQTGEHGFPEWHLEDAPRAGGETCRALVPWHEKTVG